MKQSTRAALIACMVWAAGPALATPGAVDEKGCHQSQKIGFHCHPMRVKDEPGRVFVAVVPGADCQAKPRRKACKGLPKK